MKHFRYNEEIDSGDYYSVFFKTHKVLEYCQPHIDKMWAASVVGTLLGCDFRDSEYNLKKYFEWAKQKGINLG